MARTAEQAISIARRWLQRSNRPFSFHRTCLMITRTALGIGPKYGTAIGAWNAARYKHRFNGNYNSVPRGVAFFWAGPSSAGHVVLTTGNGLCFTNDLAGAGTFTIARLETVTRKWGATPKGWTEDVNGVRYYKKPAAPVKKVTTKTVDYSKFVDGVRAKRVNAGQQVHISRVKKALRERVGLDSSSTSGQWDSHARAAAKRWQELLKHKQTGQLNAAELKRLGRSPKVRSRFRIVA